MDLFICISKTYYKDFFSEYEIWHWEDGTLLATIAKCSGRCRINLYHMFFVNFSINY